MNSKKRNIESLSDFNTDEMFEISIESDIESEVDLQVFNTLPSNSFHSNTSLNTFMKRNANNYINETKQQKKQNNIQDSNTSDTIPVDELNSNVLDNNNLRTCQPSHRFKTSQYENISWIENSSKWRALIRIDSYNYLIGYYKTEENAYEKLQEISSKAHLSVITQRLKEVDDISLKRKIFAEYVNNHIDNDRKVNKSIYKGISWNTRDKCWISQITLNHQRYHVGSYQDEQIANQRRILILKDKNSLERQLSRITNRKSQLKYFADYVRQHCDETRVSTTSKHEGVYVTTSNRYNIYNNSDNTTKYWRAHLRINGERYNVGSYDSEEKAFEMLNLVKSDVHYTHLLNALNMISDRKEKLDYFAKYLSEHIDSTRNSKFSKPMTSETYIQFTSTDSDVLSHDSNDFIISNGNKEVDILLSEINEDECMNADYENSNEAKNSHIVSDERLLNSLENNDLTFNNKLWM